jgi:hypothetical protein
MKAGNLVLYVDASGVVRPATITDVGTTDRSSLKTLDLAVEGKGVPRVPHEKDVHDSPTPIGYWVESLTIGASPTPIKERPVRAARIRPDVQ